MGACLSAQHERADGHGRPLNEQALAPPSTGCEGDTATVPNRSDTALEEGKQEECKHAWAPGPGPGQQPDPAAATATRRTSAVGGPFADLSQLCSLVCKVDHCTVSTVGSKEPWLGSTGQPFHETPFCTCTLQQPSGVPLVVPDSLLDARFSSSSYVTGPPHIRFYAGVPLQLSCESHPHAALCIMDARPASEGLLPTAARQAMLHSFADMAVRELEREQALAKHEAAKEALRSERARLLRLMDLFGNGKAVLLLEITTHEPEPSSETNTSTMERRQSLPSLCSSDSRLAAPARKSTECWTRPGALAATPAAGSWRVLGVNRAWEMSTGLLHNDVEGRDFWSLFRGAGDRDAAAQVQATCVAATSSRQDFAAALCFVSAPAVAGMDTCTAAANACTDAVAASADAKVVSSAALDDGCDSAAAPGQAARSGAGAAGADIMVPDSQLSQTKAQTLHLVLHCIENGSRDTRHRGDSAHQNANALPAVLEHSGPRDAAAAAAAGPCYYCVSIGSDKVGSAPAHSSSRSSGLPPHDPYSGGALPSSSTVGSGSSVVTLLGRTRSSFVDDRSPLLDEQMNMSSQLQVISLLGHGSFGRVYLGKYNGSAVAVKVLEWEGQAGAEHVLEALLSTQIDHPNIVRAYKHATRPLRMLRQSHEGERGSYVLGDADRGGERQMMETWIVMQYADRGTLTDAVELGWFRSNRGPRGPDDDGGLAPTSSAGLDDDDLDLGTIIATALDVASAMLYLHGLQILHGDLTGSNILLCSTDSCDKRRFAAKVADFGLSRVLATDSIRTKTYGAVSHTPPELLLTGHLSKAVDVYAFGVILWEMVMGERPFRGLTEAQIINHISSGRGLALRSECPSALRKLVGSCLSLRPEQRPNFTQVVQQLQALQEEL